MPPDSNPARPVVYTVNEVAEILRVDRKSVYAMVRRHELPAVRIGKQIRVAQAALLDWLGRDGSRTQIQGTDQERRSLSCGDQVRVVPKGNDDDS